MLPGQLGKDEKKNSDSEAKSAPDSARNSIRSATELEAKPEKNTDSNKQPKSETSKKNVAAPPPTVPKQAPNSASKPQKTSIPNSPNTKTVTESVSKTPKLSTTIPLPTAANVPRNSKSKPKTPKASFDFDKMNHTSQVDANIKSLISSKSSGVNDSKAQLNPKTSIRPRPGPGPGPGPGATTASVVLQNEKSAKGSVTPKGRARSKSNPNIETPNPNLKGARTSQSKKTSTAQPPDPTTSGSAVMKSKVSILDTPSNKHDRTLSAVTNKGNVKTKSVRSKGTILVKKKVPNLRVKPEKLENDSSRFESLLNHTEEILEGFKPLERLVGVYIQRAPIRSKTKSKADDSKKFNVTTVAGEVLYVVHQYRFKSRIKRIIWGINHSFLIKIFEATSNKEIFHIEHKCTCLVCPGSGRNSRSNAIVTASSTGFVLGEVIQICTVLTPRYVIRDDEYNGEKIIMRIEGPFCGQLWPFNMDDEARFKVNMSNEYAYSISSDKKFIGTIMKQAKLNKTAFPSDENVFGMQLPPDLNPRLKAVLIGAIFYVVFSYYNRRLKINVILRIILYSLVIILFIILAAYGFNRIRNVA